jgi:hypothetical protein
MVANIIRSEFILNKNILLLFLSEIVAFTIIYVILMNSGTAVLALAALLTGILPAAALARQSKFKAEDMICSLPVTRNRFILGKFAFIGILMLISICIAYFIVAVMPHEGFATKEILHPDVLVNTLIAMSLLAGFLVPLVISFGFMGMMILILGVNLITVGIFVLTFLKLIDNGLDFVFRDIPAAFSSLRATMGAPYYHLLLLGCAVLVGFLSLKISQFAYQRKDF